MFRNAKLISNLVEQCFKFNEKIVNTSNVKYSRRLFRTFPSLSEKKKGTFVDKASHNETERTKKVKLYPGFQTSSEEFQQQMNDEKDDVYGICDFITLRLC